MALIGSDNQTFGYNLVDNSLLHDGKRIGDFPRLKNAAKYSIGESLTLVINRDADSIYFEKDGQFLGVAFTNLPPVRLYPAICAVYGNSEVDLVYESPLSG